VSDPASDARLLVVETTAGRGAKDSRSLRERLVDPIALLYRNRHLTWALAQRDLLVPYAGQFFGALWTVGHPLFLAALLAVVFNYLVGARFGGSNPLPLDYTVFLLAGLLPWQTFATVLGTASSDVVSNENLVKQVVFPVEVLPVKGVINALPTLGVGLVFLLVYVLLTAGAVPWTFVLVPVLVLVQVVWMCGVALLLSATGVFFRDLKDVMRLFVAAGVYLLPVIYRPGFMPEVLRPLVVANPLSVMVWCYQDALYFGRFEHPWAWVAYPSFALVTFYGGFTLFQRLRPFFGNVL
jgi:lipopolysaccharide transport system permease protein